MHGLAVRHLLPYHSGLLHANPSRRLQVKLAQPDGLAALASGWILSRDWMWRGAPKKPRKLWCAPRCESVSAHGWTMYSAVDLIDKNRLSYEFHSLLTLWFIKKEHGEQSCCLYYIYT